MRNDPKLAKYVGGVRSWLLAAPLQGAARMLWGACWGKHRPHQEGSPQPSRGSSGPKLWRGAPTCLEYLMTEMRSPEGSLLLVIVLLYLPVASDAAILGSSPSLCLVLIIISAINFPLSQYASHHHKADGREREGIRLGS